VRAASCSYSENTPNSLQSSTPNNSQSDTDANARFRTCRCFAPNFSSSNSHRARQPVNSQKVLRIFYGSDPQRQHARRLLPGNSTVFGLGGARRVSGPRRHRTDHGRRIYRNPSAPGCATHGQAAHGSHPDAVFLADRKRCLGHESGAGSQNREILADRRQDAGIRRG
jgi:hypothetical protein